MLLGVTPFFDLGVLLFDLGILLLPFVYFEALEPLQMMECWHGMQEARRDPLFVLGMKSAFFFLMKSCSLLSCFSVENSCQGIAALCSSSRPIGGCFVIFVPLVICALRSWTVIAHIHQEEDYCISSPSASWSRPHTALGQIETGTFTQCWGLYEV